MLPANISLKQIDEVTWEIPRSYKTCMQVPARLIATKLLLDEIDEVVFDQLTNVACLPGLVNYAWVMPDGHSGYGAPIGAVFATDPDQEGVISPGAVGFDINCGVRLVRTDLTWEEVKPKVSTLVNEMFTTIPTGVGARGAIKISRAEFKKLLKNGSRWCLNNGLAWPEDTEYCEEGGCLAGADPDKVSERAFRRGINQVGTLGSGNHYLEIQVVDEIFDEKLANTLGISGKNQVVFMVHCGSRGLGHQVASDYLRLFEKATIKYRIKVLDQQLVCAPLQSPEGQGYFAAMACAVNMAFANRQTITHLARGVIARVFNQSPESLGMNLVYDVAHNIAKLERHELGDKEPKVKGKKRKDEDRNQGLGKILLVHRKGATRSFGPQRPEFPKAYWGVGQPVLLGGSMETDSYLMVGTEMAMRKTFGSTAHGSGRTMSRAAAKRQVRGEELQQKMLEEGIYVKSASLRGLAEEAGVAYKNIHEVVRAVDLAGISKLVARFRPVGNIKG